MIIVKEGLTELFESFSQLWVFVLLLFKVSIFLFMSDPVIFLFFFYFMFDILRYFFQFFFILSFINVSLFRILQAKEVFQGARIIFRDGFSNFKIRLIGMSIIRKIPLSRRWVTWDWILLVLSYQLYRGFWLFWRLFRLRFKSVWICGRNQKLIGFRFFSLSFDDYHLIELHPESIIFRLQVLNDSFLFSNWLNRVFIGFFCTLQLWL